MAAILARLPVPPSTLIGREREIAHVLDLLTESRLVTLTGPGGTGKTRLALAVLAELQGTHSEGAVFVDLSPLADPQLVPSAIGRALGLEETGDRPVEETLAALLARSELVLCLDNFEQLLEAASVVSRLLAAAPGLVVLTTSRAPLRLAGEREYQVPPLEPTEAAELFAARARQAKDGFALDDENRAAIAEICAELDRLPLAIELAAARVRALPPQKLRERLRERLPLLTQGARDAPARQQTLRATIDWSYGLLDDAQRTLLARLSVFAGGCTLEAAEVVCGADLDTLTALVEQSLVREEAIFGEPRYTLLETVREYAFERLQERGEEEAYCRRHLDYFLALAEEVEPLLFGAAKTRQLDRLELELDNLRAALGLAIDSGAAEPAERLAAAFSTALVEMSRLHESGRWLEAALALAGDVPPEVRATTLRMLGYVVFRHGELRRAQLLLEDAVRLLRAVGDEGRLAHTLSLLVWVRQRAGEREAVARLVEEITPLLPRLRSPSDRCDVLIYLGWICAESGDLDGARAFFEEEGRIAQEHGDRAVAADALNATGWLAMLEGDYERARLLKEEALAIARESKHRFTIALVLGGLGVVCALQADFARAAAVLAENLPLVAERGDARLATESLAVAAARAAATGEAAAAARLGGAAEALYERTGAQWNPTERLLLERYVWPERERLEEFDEAWAEGRALGQDEAIGYALETLDGARGRVAPPPPREPAFSELDAGAVVGGFEVEAFLGRGGMGVVYRARQRSLDRAVALKVVAPALAADEAFRQRFLREARLAAAIEHPNVLPVYEAGEDGARLFLAARYVEGETLASLLARAGPLPAARAVEIVARVGAALDAAHARGLVHRDVKPSNILLDEAGGVYLCDFGLATSGAGSKLTRTGELLGTLAYIAPEQIRQGSVDGRADQYSLACVLFECLTGEAPFTGETEAQLLWAHMQERPPSVVERRPDLPIAIDAVLAKALAKEPAERFTTVRELAEAALAALVGEAG
jgi:predicted ATPase/predicted Ser/Thr protein kinase